MHERRLVDNIVNRAIEVVNESGSESAERVMIEIGALNHATCDSLREMLVDAVSGTVLDNAVFDIVKSSDTGSGEALDVRLVSMTVKGD